MFFCIVMEQRTTIRFFFNLGKAAVPKYVKCLKLSKRSWMSYDCLRRVQSRRKERENLEDGRISGRQSRVLNPETAGISAWTGGQRPSSILTSMGDKLHVGWRQFLSSSLKEYKKTFFLSCFLAHSYRPGPGTLATQVDVPNMYIQMSH
jgi:hypothetical protein